MANIKSARKRARQAVGLREHNMSLRTEVRTAIKNAKKAIAAGKPAEAAKALRVLHRNAGTGTRAASRMPLRA